MPGSRRLLRDRTTARHALVRLQRHVGFNVRDQRTECGVCVRLDRLELRERVLEGLDVIAVLHLIKPVGSCAAEMERIGTTDGVPPSFWRMHAHGGQWAAGHPWCRSPDCRGGKNKHTPASAAWRSEAGSPVIDGVLAASAIAAPRRFDGCPTLKACPVAHATDRRGARWRPKASAPPVYWNVRFFLNDHAPRPRGCGLRRRPQ